MKEFIDVISPVISYWQTPQQNGYYMKSDLSETIMEVVWTYMLKIHFND